LKRAIAALLCLCYVTGAAQEQEFVMRPALPSPEAKKALLLDLDWVGDRLVAVGEQGHIIYSDDGGTTWSHAEVPVSLMITAVDFPDGDDGWAVGHEGLVLASKDRGETWSIALTGEDIAGLQIEAAERLVEEVRARLDEAPEEEAEDAQWALEEAEFALEDARRAEEEGFMHPALNVWFRDADNGYVTGAYGMLLRTSDGGSSWQLQSNRLDNPNGYHLYDIAQSRSGSLIVVGEAGQLHRSRDDGQTWEALDSPYEGSYFGVIATDKGSLLIFGLRGRIFRSEDDGDSWTAIDAPGESTLFDGRVVANGPIVLVGAAGTVLESTDDGRSFSKLSLDTRASLAGVVAARSGNPGNLIIAGFGGIHAGVETTGGAAP
jgi:photosystem II stability/assembly factor-like uncharacterized protein